MPEDNINKSGAIAYIVSMGAGLEAFIYREVEALYERGYAKVCGLVQGVP